MAPTRPWRAWALCSWVAVLTTAAAAQVAESDPQESCQLVCVPESAWNGTHCVLGVAEAAAAADEQIDGYAGFVLLGVAAAVGVVALAAALTEHLLDPAPRLPQVAAGVDPLRPTGDWQLPPALLCFVTTNAGEYQRTLEQHREVLEQLEGVSAADDVLECYRDRLGQKGAVLHVDDARGACRVLLQDGARLWFPSGLVYTSLPDARASSAERLLAAADSGAGTGPAPITEPMAKSRTAAWLSRLLPSRAAASSSSSPAAKPQVTTAAAAVAATSSSQSTEAAAPPPPPPAPHPLPTTAEAAAARSPSLSPTSPLPLLPPPGTTPTTTAASEPASAGVAVGRLSFARTMGEPPVASPLPPLSPRGPPPPDTPPPPPLTQPPPSSTPPPPPPPPPSQTPPPPNPQPQYPAGKRRLANLDEDSDES